MLIYLSARDIRDKCGYSLLISRHHPGVSILVIHITVMGSISSIFFVFALVKQISIFFPKCGITL